MGLFDGLKRRAATSMAMFALRQAAKGLSEGKYGEGKMKLYKRVVDFMDGKKTYTGALLIALPAVATALATSLIDAGFDPNVVAKYAAYAGGTVLTVIGLLHKAVKFLDDLTPDEFPGQ